MSPRYALQASLDGVWADILRSDDLARLIEDMDAFARLHVRVVDLSTDPPVVVASARTGKRSLT